MGLITRSSIVNQFNSQVANYINPTWHRNNVPQYASSSEFGYTSSMSTSDISSSNPITASTVVSNLVSVCREFTSVRNCRVVATKTVNDNVQVISDETRLAAMNSHYTQWISPSLSSVISGQLIRTIDMNSLYNAWSSARYNTVTLTYNTYTQHVSHGSRSRR